MSAIYIHIPFCKSKCAYCDFYSIANNTLLPDYVNSLLKEVNFQKKNFNHEIKTIYFGGGTPSLLSIKQIEKILTEIFNVFIVEKNPEISFEANPDDLSQEYLVALKAIGINRLSIGIQSFSDEILKFLKRQHNSATAINSILTAHKVGFNNISTDLIYGIDGQTNKQWQNDLKKILKFPITHLSAYHLGIEEKTLLQKYLLNGKINKMNEIQSFEQYKILLEECKNNDFEQYEISNFAKYGFFSKHNYSYWNGTEYLGLGASAHSFFENKRFWNIANVKTYMDNIFKNDCFYESENLSEKDRYNEFIMLGLRTTKGLFLKKLQENFNENFYTNFIQSLKQINSKFYTIENGFLKLNLDGMFVSDYIIQNLFKI